MVKFKNPTDFAKECPEYLNDELSLHMVRNGVFYYRGELDKYILVASISDYVFNMNFDLTERLTDLLGHKDITLFINGIQYLGNKE